MSVRIAELSCSLDECQGILFGSRASLRALASLVAAGPIVIELAQMGGQPCAEHLRIVSGGDTLNFYQEKASLCVAGDAKMLEIFSKSLMSLALSATFTGAHFHYVPGVPSIIDVDSLAVVVEVRDDGLPSR